MRKKIYVLVDNINSWFVPYAKQLVNTINSNGYESYLIHNSDQNIKGDICFLLSCTKLVKKEFLNNFSNCIVIHASDLPQGKGFSPLQHQILEGKNEIVLTLFEVVEAMDAGPFYLKDKITFNGLELLPELRDKMALKIQEMCIKYLNDYEELTPIEQSGEESFYARFTKENDRIDIDKTLREQINHIRVADNNKFPLWFEYGGRKYILKVYPKEELD